MHCIARAFFRDAGNGSSLLLNNVLEERPVPSTHKCCQEPELFSALLGLKGKFFLLSKHEKDVIFYKWSLGRVFCCQRRAAKYRTRKEFSNFLKMLFWSGRCGKSPFCILSQLFLFNRHEIKLRTNGKKNHNSDYFLTNHSYLAY